MRFWEIAVVCIGVLEIVDFANGVLRGDWYQAIASLTILMLLTVVVHSFRADESLIEHLKKYERFVLSFRSFLKQAVCPELRRLEKNGSDVQIARDIGLY